MRCPVCKTLNRSGMNLHAEGFYENIFECKACGATWSVNHGVTEVISDPQKDSFLQGVTETVEADDYNRFG